MDDDDQRTLLNWTYLYQEKSMDEELRHTLLLTMELEETKLKAEEDLKIRDEQILHLKELLTTAIKERDEAQQKLQKVFFEKVLLQQQLQQCQQSTPHSGVSSSIEDDDSIVSSPPQQPQPAAAAADLPVAINGPLPEKGKLLQAVMKAGPLLQTLLLAGPLPQWRHPPPPVDAYQIPPPPVVVPPSPLPTISTHFIHQDSNISVNKCRKKDLPEGSDFNNQFKYQRVVLQ